MKSSTILIQKEIKTRDHLKMQEILEHFIIAETQCSVKHQTGWL